MPSTTFVDLSRFQFATTAAFHMTFPALSVGLAIFLVICYGAYCKTGNPLYLQMFRFWRKIFAVGFALGIVAGIVLTFELGLNWGTYARAVGPILGPIICLEALTAFFLEAGFIGILLYGEGRVSRRVTMVASCLVALGALLSTAWILSANSWMQTPAGYREVNGQFQPTNWCALHRATLQMLARLRARVFASAAQMTPRQLRRFHSGDLLDRIQADIDSLDRVVLAVAVPAVVAAIVGAAGLAVLALIRPAFAAANAVALTVALAGDLVAWRQGRRAGGELARAWAAARARLVEVFDGRTEIATYGVGLRALAELGERFGATDAPRRSSPAWPTIQRSGSASSTCPGAVLPS